MKSMKIGIVSGEASGDILGAGLIKALKRYYPSCQFSGIGGERMIAEGFDSLYPQDRLAVMGLVEPLKRLPELLRIRKHLYQYFIQHRFDVVIGIDSPDFNLTLEKKLRRHGVKTVHYVSPSVWAWRQGRIKLIKKAVDLMLTLLPFEADFYHQHDVPVTFVGHPLADKFPLEPKVDEAKLKLSKLLPAQNDLRRKQIEEQLANIHNLPIHLVDGNSQAVMAAADCIVMASGTTTLEAMLLKKPMVVVYKKSPLSYAILSRLVKVSYISLPNLLANKEVVPELLQDKATPEAIMAAVKYWLDNPLAVDELKQTFADVHPQLKMGASEKSAESIKRLIEQGEINE
jgi:lipid-A-disaccharide synthase